MERKGAVSRAEWRWVAIWLVVALIVTSVPYVVGALSATPDKAFGGFVMAIEDGYSYLAKMNEGAHGAWLFTLPYTSEPHTATVFYLFHLLLGKVAALSGVPLAVMYHIARLLFDALLLVVVYRFVAQFTGARAVRKIAFLLIAFSGGLGWLLLLTGQTNWLGSLPIDLISPEAFTFLGLYLLPHLALARALMLLGLLFFWQKTTTTRDVALAGLCWLLMGVLVPFYVAVVGAIVIAGLIAQAIVRRRVDWHEIGRAALSGLIAAPILIYTFIVVATDPIWNIWQAQLIILSPHPLHYVVGYALVGGLAIIGIVRKRKFRIQNPELFGWLIVVPFLIYLPFNSQRRLIEGWQIPLAIFAAIGLVTVVLPAWRRSRLVRRLAQHRRYSARGLRQWLLASMLLFSAATYVLLLTEQSTRMLARTPPSFRDGGEVAAMQWLDQRVTYNDVILSAYDTGNFLPTMVGARVYLGHGPETANSADKLKSVRQFYTSATFDDWRREFLKQGSISYVFAGPLERKLGAANFAEMNYLTLEYDRDGYRIYRVTLP